MSAATRTRISLKEPKDVIAALPHLLGFHPENSIVVIFHGGRSSAVELTTRSDIPAPENYGTLARRLAAMLAEIEPGPRPRRVTTVVVGAPCTGTADDALPARGLVEAVTRAFADAGVATVHALWTEATRRGARWRCYQDTACAGTVADPACSVAAAAFAASGAITYASREELCRVCDPPDPAAVARRAVLLDRVTDGGGVPPTATGLSVVRGALDSALRGDCVLDDDAVVRLAVALSDHRVRDACLVPGTPEREEAAMRLWIALTRETPAPERAEPACLLACLAYLRGDGALAGVALDRALAADPGHTLGGLLRTAQCAAVSPGKLREYLGTAVDAARESAERGGRWAGA